MGKCADVEMLRCEKIVMQAAGGRQAADGRERAAGSKRQTASS